MPWTFRGTTPITIGGYSGLGPRIVRPGEHVSPGDFMPPDNAQTVNSNGYRVPLDPALSPQWLAMLASGEVVEDS